MGNNYSNDSKLGLWHRYPYGRYYTSRLSLKMTLNDRQLDFLVESKLLLEYVLMHLPPTQKVTEGLAWLILVMYINNA